MSALQKITYLSENDYLAFELTAPIKHEYIDGDIYAMAGASNYHNRISGNIFFQLRSKTRGSGCSVFATDMKLRIPQMRTYYYPDVMLSCHNSPEDDEYYIHQPCLIAEVLSQSTKNTDRREKWHTYQQIAHLRYYLLVDSRKKQVDYFIRSDEGIWQQAQLEEGETLTIICESYQTTLTLADIYEDIIF
jgi:Uma2 family endonuclease